MERRSPATALTPQRLGRLRSLLLEWYDEHAQPFPWREGRDPYAALVAGVCSQQTQMSRVLPLWERWMAAFPTLEACAAADRAEVLRAWDNAGYPRRAVALHEATRRCMAEHGGALPREEDALRALPGVGPFTAAIVRCFGFGEDSVAIDTNIVRVIGRLVHGDLQPVKETDPGALRESAATLLRPGTAARWNPALMDYGAKVCRPRPHCDICVVAHLCAAQPRFEAGERAEPVRAQPAFEGSDRQRRGHVLRELREADGAALRTGTLLRRLARSGLPRTEARRLLGALVADGLAWQRDGRCGLGDGPPSD